MEVLVPELDEIRKKVLTELVIPSYEKEVKDGLHKRVLWDKLSTFFYTMSIILGSAAGVIAFASGSEVFKNQSTTLTFISGTFSSLGTAFIIFSKYCEAQSKESTKKANTLLKSMGISLQIPDIPSDVIESSVQKKQTQSV